MRFARSRPTVVTCMADGSSLWRHTTTTTLGARCRSAGAVHPINSNGAQMRAASGAERKHVTLPTDFRSRRENGHSRHGQLTARFAPELTFDPRPTDTSQYDSQ